MLDDQHGIPRVHQLLQHLQQFVHVVHMQTCGRLIKDIHGASGGAAGKLCCQLDALCLTAGKGGRALSETDVAQTDLYQCFHLIPDARQVFKKLQRLVSGHFQYVCDGFAAIEYLQRFAIVPLAAAHVAGDIDIRQEVHFDFDQTIAAARLAAAALNIEGKAS